MNIVILDADTIGQDIDLSAFEKLGNVTVYGFSSPEEMRERAADADVIILNKMLANAQTLEKASHLKLICVTATGTNNLDKDYLAQRGIAWRNVAGYSTECVTQHTFAMLFYLLEKLPYYDRYVKSEAYVDNTTFTHFTNVFHELCGMTWGIIGLGAIGQRVAQVAAAFGCRIIYYSASGQHDHPDYERVSFDELLSRSDIVSVHAPLTDRTEGLMNRQAFQK
ncbi:putative 2-hydroxyacid dehydrogenase [Eubacterium plexicaudatum ASF492]|nr:putative 2-hydroxyacid dehydrogenase [Eubacterium plexicaudatum ASF492]